MIETPPASFFPGLASYLEIGIGCVEGWLSPMSAAVIAQLLVQQSREGIRGDVCEIGVHHGKLFLLLANATLPGERAVAVDIFSDQEKNIDLSGAGDRAIFEHHIAAYAPGADVDIVHESSLDLEETGFLDRRLRFMSIDGGHTASIVANDLRLAEKTLLPGGIVALDDVLSHEWTGVITGLADYLSHAGSLVPFALTPNKLLLSTDLAAAAHGRTTLMRWFPLALSKRDLEFLGGLVDSYHDHTYYTREGHAGLRQELSDLRRMHVALQGDYSHRVDPTQLHHEIDVLGQSIGTLQAELAAAKASEVELRGSWSWRITSPLRMLGAAVLGRRGANTLP